MAPETFSHCSWLERMISKGVVTEGLIVTPLPSQGHQHPIS